MTGTPLINCIVPVFNGERFLAESLESIFAQTYRNINVLVVDDGSQDGTADVLRGFGDRLQVIRQENGGPSKARSRGLAETTADFVAFQDADDLWLPEKLELQMECLSAQPEALLCTCMLENFWVPEMAEEAEQLRGTEHDKPRVASWPGVLARRTAFEQVGGMDTEVPQNDAREWLHRARTMGVQVAHVDKVLVRRRVHPNNWSRHRGKLEPDLVLRMAEQALARRRAAQTKK